jgi:hypothetical protein
MAERVFINMRFEGPDAGTYSRGFEAWSRAVEDMSPVMRRIGDDVVEDVGNMFGTEGAMAGAPYPPLSPGYAKQKEAEFPGRPILVRTGRMRREMLDKLTAVHVSKDRMLYEPVSGIAMYHQKGTEHMPARRMVAFTAPRMRQWDRYWAEWLAADRDAWLP